MIRNQQPIFAAAPGEILVIAPSAYPLGGVATWLDYLVPGLRERGWSVTLGLVEGRFHDVGAYLDVHPDDNVVRISYGTGTQEGRVRKLVGAILRRRPDIVLMVNIADAIPAVERIRAISKWSPRIVMTLHAVEPDFIGSIRNDARILDAVVCTNQLSCELVARCTSITRSRIFYAPYGVETNTAPKADLSLDDILRIAYVGRLERAQKRIEDVGSIVAELERRGVAYELIIAGGGPDAEWLRTELADPVARAKVRFLGTLAGIDLADQVYGQADALLITSLWETGPIVAWEAMAKGVAVVTSAYIGSGLEASLEPGNNCLMFPIGNAVAAVDCLERVGDKELRLHLVRGGYALVASRYSTTSSVERWHRTLIEVAARPPLDAATEDYLQGPPAGRLDKLFGRRMGETIRELLGFKYEHTAPGGEWPHAGPQSETDETAFWQLAMSLEHGSKKVLTL